MYVNNPPIHMFPTYPCLINTVLDITPSTHVLSSNTAASSPPSPSLRERWKPNTVNLSCSMSSPASLVNSEPLWSDATDKTVSSSFVSYLGLKQWALIGANRLSISDSALCIEILTVVAEGLSGDSEELNGLSLGEWDGGSEPVSCCSWQCFGYHKWRT